MHQKSLPPRGKAIFFRLIPWLPLGGKLSTKLTDEGQLQYRLNSFLQITSCPPHHLASQGASPAGEAYIFALFSWLPLGGKLSTKLTDEGQLQYRLNSFLQKTSCPPSPCFARSFPRGGSLYFRLISWLPLGGKLSTKLTDEGQLQYRVNSFLQKTSCPPHPLASQGASPAGEAYICGKENRGLFFIFSPLFSQSF